VNEIFDYDLLKYRNLFEIFPIIVTEILYLSYNNVRDDEFIQFTTLRAGVNFDF
jgi:hypothetical protein